MNTFRLASEIASDLGYPLTLQESLELNRLFYDLGACNSFGYVLCNAKTAAIIANFFASKEVA